MGQKIFEKCRQKRSCDIKKDRTISGFFFAIFHENGDGFFMENYQKNSVKLVLDHLIS